MGQSAEKMAKENGISRQEQDAIALGWTGPTLRSTGVPYDVRKAHPYLTYDQYDFDVPVGSAGGSLGWGASGEADSFY